VKTGVLRWSLKLKEAKMTKLSTSSKPSLGYQKLLVPVADPQAGRIERGMSETKAKV